MVLNFTKILKENPANRVLIDRPILDGPQQDLRFVLSQSRDAIFWRATTETIE